MAIISRITEITLSTMKGTPIAGHKLTMTTKGEDEVFKTTYTQQEQAEEISKITPVITDNNLNDDVIVELISSLGVAEHSKAVLTASEETKKAIKENCEVLEGENGDFYLFGFKLETNPHLEDGLITFGNFKNEFAPVQFSYEPKLVTARVKA